MLVVQASCGAVLVVLRSARMLQATHLARGLVRRMWSALLTFDGSCCDLLPMQRTLTGVQWLCCILPLSVFFKVTHYTTTRPRKHDACMLT
jgi:hypothetical protein